MKRFCFLMPRAVRVVLLGVLAAAGLWIGEASADQVIYDSIPSPLPANLPSEGYQCCQMSEFGDEIQFAGSYRTLDGQQGLRGHQRHAGDVQPE